MDAAADPLLLVYRPADARPSQRSMQRRDKRLAFCVLCSLVAALGCAGPDTSTPSPAPEQQGETAEQTAAASSQSDDKSANVSAATAEAETSELPIEPEPLPPPAGAKRLSPDYEIWIHKKRGEVIIGGLISQRRAVLEMLACTRNTLEHESIVSANTQAYMAHAALLKLGAEPGHPVRWVDKYEPPTGTEIEIEMRWRDPDGTMQQTRAQQWVRDVRTGKEMTHPWVFGGSGLWKDPETGQEYYIAEEGYFICVSNFSSAMLDVPFQSTNVDDSRLFEAYTERIPPLGTPVHMVLRPKLAPTKEPAP